MSASPFVPGEEKISAREMVRFVTSRGGRSPFTRTSWIGSSGSVPGGGGGGGVSGSGAGRIVMLVSSPTVSS
ncbi:MAG: hypothetical protein U0270_15885 [Labilithrix sp.]